ncbi:hypothetical protein ACIRPK_29375 [Kitasatospora sp. NPDC101801]|uniref:hypothetical protein n=1 Tax=Kitasatospora sp. NPDC101801 TaxID=3364103 RepID=UPI00380F426A
MSRSCCALKINLPARRYAVLTAATGAEGLDLAGRQLPEAVLLDLGPPELDGMDVIRGLRAGGPVPIIVVSGLRRTLNPARPRHLVTEPGLGDRFEP